VGNFQAGLSPVSSVMVFHPRQTLVLQGASAFSKSFPRLSPIWHRSCRNGNRAGQKVRRTAVTEFKKKTGA
jgi:hypothetical protein